MRLFWSTVVPLGSIITMPAQQSTDYSASQRISEMELCRELMHSAVRMDVLKKKAGFEHDRTASIGFAKPLSYRSDSSNRSFFLTQYFQRSQRLAIGRDTWTDVLVSAKQGS